MGAKIPFIIHPKMDHCQDEETCNDSQREKPREDSNCESNQRIEEECGCAGSLAGRLEQKPVRCSMGKSEEYDRYQEGKPWCRLTDSSQPGKHEGAPEKEPRQEGSLLSWRIPVSISIQGGNPYAASASAPAGSEMYPSSRERIMHT